jgi:hypothetical protein
VTCPDTTLPLSPRLPFSPPACRRKSARRGRTLSTAGLPWRSGIRRRLRCGSRWRRIGGCPGAMAAMRGSCCGRRLRPMGASSGWRRSAGFRRARIAFVQPAQFSAGESAGDGRLFVSVAGLGGLSLLSA